jgi:hypothetical protein
MMDGACSSYEGEERLRGFCWVNMRRRVHLEDLGINGRLIHAFKLILKEQDGKVCIGFNWLRRGTGSELL